MSDSLVERLKREAAHAANEWPDTKVEDTLEWKAASALESLRAENAALKHDLDRSIAIMGFRDSQASASSDASKPEETRTAAAPDSVAQALLLRVVNAEGMLAFIRKHACSECADYFELLDGLRDALPPVGGSSVDDAQAGLSTPEAKAQSNEGVRDTAPVGSQGGDDSGCGHDHGVER